MNAVEYPEEWFGGKFRGNILKRENYWKMEIKDNNRKLVFTKNLYFNDELEKERNYEKAKEILREENEKRGWVIKNRMRYIDKETIEVKLNNDQIMKTDSKFIGIINDNLIYSVKSGGKLGKYYAMIYLGKKENGKNDQLMFHMFITGNKMTDHINRDTLDNRMCNLRDATYKENNDNKTFTTYQNENSSGTRGVTKYSVQNAWVAKIITNKVNEDGSKRTYTKSFSINKYGDDEAKEMAIKHREEMCEKFNKEDYKAFESEEKKDRYRKRITELDSEGKIIKLECKMGCGEVLEISKFSTKGKDKYHDKCRSCKNIEKKKWMAKKREEKIAKSKEKLEENGDNQIEDYDEEIFD